MCYLSQQSMRQNQCCFLFLVLLLIVILNRSMRQKQRTAHSRRIVLAPALFSSVFILFGFVLLLLTALSFLAGPLLDTPHQHFLNPKFQEGPIEHITRKNTGVVQGVNKSPSKSLWSSKSSKHYYGCSDPSLSFLNQASKSQSNGYLLVEASGGLNQQRTGIIDAVVVARILNATLVVPRLDHTSFWKDSSNFSDIFNVDQFITSLKPFISIVEELPVSMRVNEEKIISVRVPRRCSADYYRNTVLPILQKNKVILLKQFDYRLSNRLHEDLQKLRCKVNYHALQFTKDIRAMGDMLVERLRKENGRYIALHLRFEPDMLAFTGCYYGGGEKEIQELGLLRKRWKNIPHRNPGKARRNGRCPLTPEEVGLMLHALGYSNDSYLYVASGEIYGGESTLSPLKRMFPNFYTKDALATQHDLRPFSAYSSRMAAIDFIVCDESDVFVTNNNGNMARMLAGCRRYFGHKRTIRANAKKLGSLFLAKQNMTWDDFASRMRKLQKGFMGDPNEMRPGRGQFFENPMACICQATKTKQSNKKQLQRMVENSHVGHVDELKSEKDEQQSAHAVQDDDFGYVNEQKAEKDEWQGAYTVQDTDFDHDLQNDRNSSHLGVEDMELDEDPLLAE